MDTVKSVSGSEPLAPAGHVSGNDVPFPDSIDLHDVPRTGPEMLIGLAIRFGLMGRVSREGVPPVVRQGLRHHAQAGEPACALVLDWLDDLVLADLETAAKASPQNRR